MRGNNGLDRERLSRLLEAVGERLPRKVLPPEFAKLTSGEIRHLFRELAQHVRSCQHWRGAAACSPAQLKKGPEEAILFCDGASRGNPGPAGAGVVLTDIEGKPLVEIGRYLGRVTNNQAEYLALIRGLEAAEDLGLRRLQIFMDSELVVKQILGEYRVRHPRLRPLFAEAMSRLQRLDEYVIVHVLRYGNREADHLANQAIKRALQGNRKEIYGLAPKE